MTKIIIFSIFLLTLNCSTNKVSNIHGYRFLETKQEKIISNKSNKNDVRKLIGPPSSISICTTFLCPDEAAKCNALFCKSSKSLGE